MADQHCAGSFISGACHLLPWHNAILGMVRLAIITRIARFFPDSLHTALLDQHVSQCITALMQSRFVFSQGE